MATVGYLQTASSGTDAATYTFTSQAFGTASANRYIVAVIGSRKSGTTAQLSSVTIGGVNATIVVNRPAYATNTGFAGIAIALVPTGTSGTVVVNFNGTMVRCTLGLYNVTGITPASPNTAGVVGPTLSSSLAVTAGGATFGVSTTALNNAYTWTGLTEDYDNNETGETTYRHSSASLAESTTQTKTITATVSSSNTESALALAHFKVASTPPVADFTATPTTGYVPFTTSFTDTSTNTPTSWSWDFGDSSTSTSQNPTHSYTTAGTYTVALTATNADGSDTETKTGFITANAFAYATMTTNSVNNILSTSARINGTVTDAGDSSTNSVIPVGAVWSTTSHSDPALGSTPATSGYESNTSVNTQYTEGSSFNIPISGLTAETTYYVRIFGATTDPLGGTRYAFGNEISFTTDETRLTLDTTYAYVRGDVYASVIGKIIGESASDTTLRGFVWGTSSQEDPGNVAPASSGYTSEWNETGSFGLGYYYHDLTSLQPNTTYYYRAYAQDADGYYAYGDEGSFPTNRDTYIVETCVADTVGYAYVGANYPDYFWFQSFIAQSDTLYSVWPIVGAQVAVGQIKVGIYSPDSGDNTKPDLTTPIWVSDDFTPTNSQSDMQYPSGGVTLTEGQKYFIGVGPPTSGTGTGFIYLRSPYLDPPYGSSQEPLKYMSISTGTAYSLGNAVMAYRLDYGDPQFSFATYYIDGHTSITDSDNVWTDDANAFDGNTGTVASTTAISSDGSANYLLGMGSTAPTSGDTISSVIVKAYGTSTTLPTSIRFMDGETSLGGVNKLAASTETVRFAITIPSGGWTWSKLNQLGAKIYSAGPTQPDATATISRIEFEVKTQPSLSKMKLFNGTDWITITPQLYDGTSWKNLGT